MGMIHLFLNKNELDVDNKEWLRCKMFKIKELHMKTSQMFELSQAHDEYEGGKSGVCLVFIDGRPFDNGNLIEDFGWRRKVDYSDIARNEVFRKFVLQILKEKFRIELTLDETSFTFSRKAGCRMCPCSPGIVVRSSGFNDCKPRAIWVEISEKMN